MRSPAHGCVPLAAGTRPLACGGCRRWHARPPLARPLLHAAASACGRWWHTRSLLARPLLHAAASVCDRRVMRLPPMRVRPNRTASYGSDVFEHQACIRHYRAPHSTVVFVQVGPHRASSDSAMLGRASLCQLKLSCTKSNLGV
ncbi:hypothetical protein BHM03_00033727 [Ensete ventricosum]|nr:hypothetical protein BHM03_00033727 [Ensete ventricosum]